HRDSDGSCRSRLRDRPATSRQSHPCETGPAPCQARRQVDRRAAARAVLARRPGATAAFYFFVPFRNKFLDRRYIMRDGIKINPTPIAGVGTAKEATHGSVFLPARLLDGDPDRAV